MNRPAFLNREWILVLATVLVGALLFFFGRGSLPRQGQSTTYVITVVPADARGLACASGVALGERRCGFDAALRPVATERPLRPFVTVGRELLLLSGVFESGSVAAWLEAALRNRDDSRVTLSCYARILGVMSSVSTRWAPDGNFQPEQSVMAADIEDCVVQR